MFATSLQFNTFVNLPFYKATFRDKKASLMTELGAKSDSALLTPSKTTSLPVSQ
jgi:hypothetical protein